MFSPDETTTVAFRDFLSAMSEHAPRIVMTLPNAATEKDIRAAEERLDQPLPDALKSLYLVHNGEGRGVGHRPLFKTTLFRQTTYIPLQGDNGVLASSEQTAGLGPWIPFASNGAGSWHGIMPNDHETDPGAIVFHDMSGGSRVVARTMEDFLGGLTKKLKRKRWKVTDDACDVVVAKLYAAECLPFDNILPHPTLVEQHIQVIRVNTPTEDAVALLLDVENAPPADDDMWHFLIESAHEVNTVQITWRTDDQQIIYPRRSTHKVRRVQGRSQRQYLMSAPSISVDALHMEIRVEFTPSQVEVEA